MIEFAKVHGNGNDFIVLENMKGKFLSEDIAHLAKILCRRRFSVGADGLLLLEAPKTKGHRSPTAETIDFSMRFFNSDGSEGEMCGNGARAAARYAFEKRLAHSSMRFNTLAGIMRAQVDVPYVEVDMGDLPLEPEKRNSGSLTCRGFEFPFEFLTVGVPHCVLIMKDYNVMDDAEKRLAGREISRNFSRLPRGCNVTFAQALSNNEIQSVSYEAGVEDLTASCGTGCVAAAVAFTVRAEPPGESAVSKMFRVKNPGGVNEVRLQFAPGGASCHVRLRGKTVIVAEGQITNEALELVS